MKQTQHQLAKAEDELKLARLKIDLYNAQREKGKDGEEEQQSKHVEDLMSQIEAKENELGKVKGSRKLSMSATSFVHRESGQREMNIWHD